jgi:microcin C transport system substrate-binding protein
MLPLALALALLLATVTQPAPASTLAKVRTAHAVAMSGDPKYPAGFSHFAYVNPQAPKGGLFRQATIGAFDTFNPYVPKGYPAEDIGLIYDTLTVRSEDEPFTQYGLVADRITLPQDRSWVRFHIDPRARFHDGHPITAQDVAFTFRLLMKHGAPTYKQYYADVKDVQVLDQARVEFTFKAGENKELPLIIGQLPVLPEHFWEEKSFPDAGLTVPLGSGPYRIADFKAGQFVRYERVEDYWARNHPANVGRYNFDAVRYDCYRDETVALEAFKAGEFDFRLENTSKSWAKGYDCPALKQGRITKEEISHSLPQGMQAFAMNLRRSVFQDRKTRLALAYAFDFQWSNEHLFFGQYTRTASYFSNSELASSGPPSEAELNILEPYRKHLPPEVFTQAYSPPSTAGDTTIRENLRTAHELLAQAGWRMENGRLTDDQGRPLSFEILLQSPAFQRVCIPYTKNLQRLGIDASIRLVDTSQYITRMREFDFDMTVAVLPQSLSPGNEQRSYFHSSAADMPGSNNYMGIANPAVDALVDKVISAPDRESLIVRTRALDRALLWGHYLVPHWHTDVFRVAYWDKLKHPHNTPPYGLGLYTWWVQNESGP